MEKREIKSFLENKLREEHCFWSYAQSSVQHLPDEILIEKTLRHLDIEEIDLLFSLYSFRKVKHVWLNQLVPQGNYLYTLNRFYAWYYFEVKHPDVYLKSMTTRYFNRQFSK